MSIWSGRGGASVRARASLCLFLSFAGADILRHHLGADGGQWWRCGCAIPVMPSPGRRCPFVLAHVAVAHKEARFLFPLAILATAFPVLGFSPRLPLWRESFARVWRWRTSWAAKIVTGISLLAMVYFALYPFGVRPHMPMARYLYRHDPGPIYSFTAPFQSYPMYRPPGFRSRQLKDQAQLDALCWTRVRSFLMSQTPVPPRVARWHRALPCSIRNFPLARFGYGQARRRLHPRLHAPLPRATVFSSFCRYTGTRSTAWSVPERSSRRSQTAFRNAVRH